jgi:hypothetical protein
MDPIEFADGFDRPDRIAFGLSGGQLAVVMVGALGAYSLVRSPLPPVFADPIAAVLVALAAGLGWMRVAGRPLLDWAIFAGLFVLRARRGITRFAMAVDAVPSWFSAGESTVAPGALFAPRSSAANGSAVVTQQSFSAQLGPTSTPRPAAGQLAPVAVPRSSDLEVALVETASAPIIDLFASRQTRPARAASATPAVTLSPRRDGPRRVTFFSLRGGTGRSTLATELACILAASHSEDHPAPKVALVDSTCAARQSASAWALRSRRCSITPSRRPRTAASSTS